MSVRVMSWVWEHSVSIGAERLVLLAIADAANDAGREAYPAMATIARKANVDKRTAQRAVRALVQLGELSVQENAGPKGTHRYAVLMGQGRQDATRGDSPPRQDARGGSTPRGDSPPGVASDPAGGGISSLQGRQDATRTVLEPSRPVRKNVTSADADTPPRDDVDRLCAHLADRIEANGSKRPAVTKKWRDAARLMLDRDGRTEQQIRNAIDWCQSNEFWRANILSMPTLRDRYDRLRLEAQRAPATARASPQQETDDLFDRAAKRMGVAQ